MNVIRIAGVTLGIGAILLLPMACGGGSSGGGGSGGGGGGLYASGQTLSGAGSLGRAAGGQALSWDKPYVADLTGDGRDELLVYTSFDYLDQQDPSPFVVFGLRNGELRNITDELFPEGAPEAVINRHLLVDDFNGDGINDLFLDNHGTEFGGPPFQGEQNRLFLSDDDGQWFDKTDTHLPVIRDFSHGSTAGDINGDGRPEIFVLNLGGGEDDYNGLLYLMAQNEAGEYEVIADFENDRGGIFPEGVLDIRNAFFSQFVDLTGNGLMDLYLGPALPLPDDSGTGFAVLLKDDPDGAFELADPATLPDPRVFEGFNPDVALPEDILTGDITGNGLTDFVTFDRYGTFEGSFYSVFINKGDGTFTEETEARLPGQSFDPIDTSIPNAQLVDLDGDGHLDFIARGFNWSEDPDGQADITWIYRNNGEGFFTREDASDYPDFRPGFAVLDANGNGRNDIVTTIRDFSQSDPESFLRIYERRAGAD
jgi:hypothetical protein